MAGQELDLNVAFEADGHSMSAKDLLDIDDTNLNNEFACQASRYAYFAVLEARAEVYWQEAQQHRKEEEAEAFIEYKNDAEIIPPGGRTVSDSLANNMVALDESCTMLRQEEIQAQHRYKMMRAITSAFFMRAGMLQSLGANLRQEYDMTNLHTQESPGKSLREVLKPSLDKKAIAAKRRRNLPKGRDE